MPACKRFSSSVAICSLVNTGLFIPKTSRIILGFAFILSAFSAPIWRFNSVSSEFFMFFAGPSWTLGSKSIPNSLYDL